MRKYLYCEAGFVEKAQWLPNSWVNVVCPNNDDFEFLCFHILFLFILTYSKLIQICSEEKQLFSLLNFLYITRQRKVYDKPSLLQRFCIDTTSSPSDKLVMIANYLFAYQIFRTTQFTSFACRHTCQIRIKQLIQFLPRFLPSHICKKETYKIFLYCTSQGDFS